MRCNIKNSIRIALSLSSMLILSACGGENVCADADVLKTVKKLFDEQQFGQFIQAPPTVFLVQEKSATLTSKDEQGGKNRCSVLVKSDIMAMARFAGTSEAEIAKIKEEAPKRGLPLTKEYLVNYTAQPMASGHNYVTVLP